MIVEAVAGPAVSGAPAPGEFPTAGAWMCGLRRVAAAEVGRERQPAVPPTIIAPVLEIIEAVREGGEEALREFAERWDGLEAGGALLRTPREMQAALESLPRADREVLERTAGRIEHFARAQLESAARWMWRWRGAGPATGWCPSGWPGATRRGGAFPCRRRSS